MIKSFNSNSKSDVSVLSQGKKKSVYETIANAEGYFELGIEFPQGMIQIPIEIIYPNQQEKLFLITFEVSLAKVKMDTEVTQAKPPAAAKEIRIWLGLGTTYQKYSQDVKNTTQVTLSNSDSPSLLTRFGYWGPIWGFDFFYRQAPGKIDEASQPFQISSGKYNWTTAEARALYRFSRDEHSRMLGLPSQWQLLLGSQMHTMPFLNIDAANRVTVKQHQLTVGTLGLGLLLGQEQPWTYEFSFNYQMPISAKGSDGNTFTVSQPVAFDARLGAAYKFAPDWRVGAFAYIQSHSYSFEYSDKSQNTQISGKQNLFYSTFDFHIGWEY
jgi:hypothetical protein